MVEISDLIIGMLLVSATSMIGLGIYGSRFSRRVPAALPYALLMFAAAAWSIVYALDLATVQLALKVFFHNLRFLALPFIPFLELWLVIEYIRKPEWLTKGRAAAILAIPVLAMIFALTSPYHDLFRYNFSVNLSGPVPVLTYSEGPFYQLYFFFTLALLLVTYGILVNETRKLGTLRNVQTILLIIALGFPTIINYLFAAGITPVPGVNMTAPLLWIAAILYTVALFRYRFLDIVPVARSRLVEVMSTLMLVLDMEGRILDMNPAARTFFLTGNDMVPGVRIEDFVPDWPSFTALCRSGEPAKLELTRDLAGGPRTFLASADIFRTPSGDPEGLVILLQEVTEQKKVEAALRQSEEKLRSLFQNMLEGFAYCRMIYDENGRPADFVYLEVNSAFGQLTGLTDVTGKKVTEVIPGIREASPRLFETYGRVAAGGEPEKFEINFTPIEKWLYVSVFSPQKDFFVAVFDDITERKLMEDSLRLTNKKLNLLSGITRHDILNQLTVLRGYLNLSRSVLTDPDRMAVYLGREEAAAANIERQITFTREYQNLGVDMPTWQDVQALAGATWASFASPNIRLIAEMGGIFIYADPLLEKVFYNLIENAVKYGGEQLTFIRFSAEKSDRGLTLLCEDDGVGIQDSDKAHLFERGFGKHTGLGLFLSREILAITGITIRETGVRGRGARFEIDVPEGAFRVQDNNHGSGRP